jgi:chemotaxis protein MotB
MGLLPWLMAAAAFGFAGYLYLTLLDEVRAHGQDKAALRDARGELLSLRAEVAHAGGQSGAAAAATLATRLTQDIGAGAVVETDGQTVLVTIEGRVLFPRGEADLSEPGERILRRVAHALERNDDQIEVRVRADGAPVKAALRDVYPTAWELSAAQAMTCVRFFAQEARIPSYRLSGTGLGDTGDEAPAFAAARRPRPGRVEIRLNAPAAESGSASAPATPPRVMPLGQGPSVTPLSSTRTR